MVQPAHLVQVYTLFVLDGVDLQWKVFERRLLPSGSAGLDIGIPKADGQKG